MLEVFHGAERRVMPGPRGPDHAVAHHPHVVVVLMAVREGVVHAHIGQAADEDKGRRVQPLQKYLQIGAEEAGVPALGNAIFADAGSEGRPQLGPLITLDTVDGLVAVELAPEVDSIAPVGFLKEDDGDVCRTGGLDDALSPTDHLRRSIHECDARLCGRHSIAALDVDDDEHRLADEHLGSFRRNHLYSTWWGGLFKTSV